jgi:hypothetical protein
MKGDFSRLIEAPDRRFSRVIAQQGRVSLDADWNEQAALYAEALRAVASDVLGESDTGLAVSVPAARAGFGLIVRRGYVFDGSSYIDLGHGHRFRLGAFTPYRIEFDLCPAGAGDIISRIVRHGDGRVHGEFAAGIDAQGFVWFERLELRESVVFSERDEIDEGDETIEIDEEIEVRELRVRRIRSAWPLSFGAFAHVAVGYLDGQIFISLDGELAAVHEAHRGAHSRRVHTLVGAGMVDDVPAEFFRGTIDAMRLHRPSQRAAGLDEVHAFDDELGGEHLPARARPELWLSAGRAYVGGVAIELDRSVRVGDQPDLPDAPLPPWDRLREPLTAYVDVWERYVDAAEMPSLLEPALRGADTSGRTRMVAQVRFLPKRVAQGRLLSQQHERGTLQLHAWAQATIDENALYRMEVHCGGHTTGSDLGRPIPTVSIDRPGRRVTLAHAAWELGAWQAGRYVEFVWGSNQRALATLTSPLDDTATCTVDALPPCGDELPALRPIAAIKYSRENASRAFRVTQLDEGTNVVTVETLPNAPVELAKGDWIELGNTASVLRGEPFDLACVTNVDASALPYVRVTLDRSIPPSFTVGDGSGAVVRRWSAFAGARPSGVVPLSPQAISLDGTFSAQASDAVYFAGDFWTFAVRTDLGPSGVLDWPRANGQYAAIPPVGIRHRYGLLADLHPRGHHLAVRDRRFPFSAHGRGWHAHEVVREVTADPEPEPRGDEPANEPARVDEHHHHHHHHHHEEREHHERGSLPHGAAVLARPGERLPPQFRDAGIDMRGSVRRPRWRMVAPDAPRAGVAQACTLRELVYVIFEDATLWSFDAARGADAWTRLADPPNRESDGAAFIAAGRHAFLIGGRSGTGELQSAVRRYDVESDQWTLCAPLPTPRAHVAVAAAGGRLFVCGGVVRGWFGREHATGRCDEYSIGRDAWSAVFAMPERRSHAVAAAYEDAVYVFGGRSSRRHVHGTTFAYSIASGVWYERAPMPNACFGARAVPFGERLWVAGGIAHTRERDLPVMRFNPEANAWGFAPSLARHREGCAMAQAQDELFAIAGTTPMGAASLIERYADRQTFRVFEYVHDHAREGEEPPLAADGEEEAGPA